MSTTSTIKVRNDHTSTSLKGTSKEHPFGAVVVSAVEAIEAQSHKLQGDEDQQHRSPASGEQHYATPQRGDERQAFEHDHVVGVDEEKSDRETRYRDRLLGHRAGRGGQRQDQHHQIEEHVEDREPAGLLPGSGGQRIAGAGDGPEEGRSEHGSEHAYAQADEDGDAESRSEGEAAEEMVAHEREALEVRRKEAAPRQVATGRAVDGQKGQSVDDGQRQRIEDQPLLVDQTFPGLAQHLGYSPYLPSLTPSGRKYRLYSRL